VRFNALFPFLPSSEKYVRESGISVDNIPQRILKAATSRAVDILKKRKDFSILRDNELEILIYPVLRLMFSAMGSDYYADLLAKYYADRTVFYTMTGNIADFFVDVGMYVDPARPAFPLRVFMSFPHIYPQVKLYHLPVRSGMVLVPPSRLPFVAGCIAYGIVRRNLPVEGKIPDDIKEAALTALRSATTQTRRARRGAGKGVGFIRRVIEASGLPDGRKRILLYWLIPYWINVEGLSVDEAVERAKEWISRQAGGKIYESWIRSDAINVKKRGIKPWSLKKVERESPDLVKMLKEMGILQ